jgi:ADP-ribose pyrophosphatase YjhB (NUDIX family)
MSPQSRTYPAFPIPAVGAVILEQEHVLLIQRGQPPAVGKWTLPGGVVEVGESPEEAIIREVQEECSVKIMILTVLDVVNRIVRDEDGKVQYHYVIIDYVARCQEAGREYGLPEIAPHAETDVRDVRWVPFQELDHYNVTEGLCPVIRAGIAMQSQWEQP